MKKVEKVKVRKCPSKFLIYYYEEKNHHQDGFQILSLLHGKTLMAEELLWIHEQKYMLSRNDQHETFGSWLK